MVYGKVISLHAPNCILFSNYTPRGVSAFLDNSLKCVDTNLENNIFPTIDNTFHHFLQHFSVMRPCSKK